MSRIQVPSIILPTVAPLGTETELTNDLLEHTSLEFPTEFLREFEINIVATEVIAAGALGNLECWIELSPVPSTTSAAYWAAIGGGGGAVAPVVPLIEVSVGVGTVHTILLPWGIHSAYARLVVQMPVSANPLTAYWAVQAVISAKGD